MADQQKREQSWASTSQGRGEEEEGIHHKVQRDITEKHLKPREPDQY